MHIGIGVDVSKGKSTICMATVEGEILYEPFEIEHTKEGMDSILEKIKNSKRKYQIFNGSNWTLSYCFA